MEGTHGHGTLHASSFAGTNREGEGTSEEGGGEVNGKVRDTDGAEAVSSSSIHFAYMTYYYYLPLGR